MLVHFIMYIHVLWCVACRFSRHSYHLLCFSLLVQMPDAPYVGFADGAYRSTRSLSSAAWVIYDPHNELIDCHGVCLGHTTNNVAEYCAVIELLARAINFGIHALIVNLDSQLVVHQLKRQYSVRNHHILGCIYV